MHDAVVGGDVIQRRGLGDAVEDALEFRVGAIGQQHRSRLRVQRIDLANAIVFLVGAGKLMLAHAVGVVVRDGRRADKTGLHVVTHLQAIDVVARGCVADQNALLDQAREVFRALGVDRRRVGIGVLREIDLRLGDVQEAVGLAFGARPRLFGVQHIVGRGRHVGRTFGDGTQTAEGTHQCCHGH